MGLNDFKDVQINTIQNGVRRLAPALAAVYGDPNLIGPLQIQSSINRSRYDELAVQFERRYIGQTSRTLSVFAEFFNLLNTANFGASYNGNGRSTLFKQPIGFIPGSGYPIQVQPGGRFTF